MHLQPLDRILQTHIGRVVLQVKPCPMFVSDALASDVSKTIKMMKAQSSNSVTSSIGERLDQYIDNGRLKLQTADEWG